MPYTRIILAALLSKATGKERTLQQPEWSDKSWTHNTFRAFEYFFGRRAGIRAEMTSRAWRDEAGRTHVEYYCHTFEAACALAETCVRNALRYRPLSGVRIYIPVAALPGGFFMPASPYLFAIAFDVADTGTSTGVSPLTWSHTVTGSNALLAVGSAVIGSSAPTTSAVSYNSVSATKARSDTGAGSVSGVSESSVWLLGSASTGANTVSVSFSGGTCVAGAASYTGAQSGNTADAVNGANGTTTGAQSFNVTTVADNCWVFATGVVTGGTTPSWNTPTQTSRWSTTLSVANDQVGQDTNAPKTPAGAVSMGWTAGGTSGSNYRWAMSGASFAPQLGTPLLVNLPFVQGVKIIGPWP